MRSLSYLCMLVLANAPAESTADADPSDHDEEQPRLHIADRTADFGESFPGRIEHTFRLENKGDAPLRIDRIKPS